MVDQRGPYAIVSSLSSFPFSSLLYSFVLSWYIHEYVLLTEEIGDDLGGLEDPLALVCGSGVLADLVELHHRNEQVQRIEHRAVLVFLFEKLARDREGEREGERERGRKGERERGREMGNERQNKRESEPFFLFMFSVLFFLSLYFVFVFVFCCLGGKGEGKGGRESMYRNKDAGLLVFELLGSSVEGFILFSILFIYININHY